MADTGADMAEMADRPSYSYGGAPSARGAYAAYGGASYDSGGVRYPPQSQRKRPFYHDIWLFLNNNPYLVFFTVLFLLFQLIHHWSDITHIFRYMTHLFRTDTGVVVNSGNKLDFRTAYKEIVEKEDFLNNRFD